MATAVLQNSTNLVQDTGIIKPPKLEEIIDRRRPLTVNNSGENSNRFLGKCRSRGKSDHFIEVDDTFPKPNRRKRSRRGKKRKANITTTSEKPVLQRPRIGAPANTTQFLFQDKEYSLENEVAFPQKHMNDENSEFKDDQSITLDDHHLSIYYGSQIDEDVYLAFVKKEFAKDYEMIEDQCSVLNKESDDGSNFCRRRRSLSSIQSLSSLAEADYEFNREVVLYEFLAEEFRKEYEAFG